MSGTALRHPNHSLVRSLAVRPELSPGRPASPIFILGISGASWKIIEPLVDSGRLPALAGLCARGARATLLSPPNEGDRFPRPQSAWATIATGVNADEHGVTSFYHEARDLRRPALWHMYAALGARVGVFGWPGTWPPPQVDGFVIPSHLGRDEQTWPPTLSWIKRLDRRFQASERDGEPARYVRPPLGEVRSFLGTGRKPLATSLKLVAAAARASRAPDEERALILRAAKLELTASLFAGLYRRHRPTFASYHTFFVDFASHRYWRYHDGRASGSRRLRTAVVAAYERTDAVLARLLGQIPAEATVFVLSEHGMSPEQPSSEVGTKRYLIRGEAVRRFAGLSDGVTTCPIARWVAYRGRTGSVPDDTAARLRSLVVAETGLPLLDVHENGDHEVLVMLSLGRDVDLYRTSKLEQLTVVSGESKATFLDLVRPLGGVRSAMHDEEAVFVAAGPTVRASADLGRVALVNVAPTILHASGVPVPAGLAGEPLESAFCC